MSLAVVVSEKNLSVFRSLRTVRALRPLRALSRLEGMKVTMVDKLFCYCASIKFQRFAISYKNFCLLKKFEFGFHVYNRRTLQLICSFFCFFLFNFQNAIEPFVRLPVLQLYIENGLFCGGGHKKPKYAGPIPGFH